MSFAYENVKAKQRIILALHVQVHPACILPYALLEFHNQKVTKGIQVPIIGTCT